LAFDDLFSSFISCRESAGGKRIRSRIILNVSMVTNGVSIISGTASWQNVCIEMIWNVSKRKTVLIIL
jgi:hypothetical protein